MESRGGSGGNMQKQICKETAGQTAKSGKLEYCKTPNQPCGPMPRKFFTTNRSSGAIWKTPGRRAENAIVLSARRPSKRSLRSRRDSDFVQSLSNSTNFPALKTASQK